MTESRSALKRQLLLICAFTAAFSLMAHGYRYLSMSFSGDAMLLSQAGEELYQTSLGRFLQPVYWQIRGYITAPLLIGLFAAAFLCGSSALICHLFGFSRPLHIALVCGILTANETLAISNATYLPWTDVYMLSMLFCVLGVFISERFRCGWLIAPVFYCLSLGLYQSYLPVAATLTILLLLLDTLRGSRTSGIWLRGVRACISLVLGLLLYAVVLRLVLAVTGAQASNDYNGVGRVALPSLDAIPRLLLDTYLTPLCVLFVPGSEVMSWHMTTIPAALHILLFACAAPLLLQRMRTLRPGAALTVLFLLFVLPLGMNFVQFIADNVVSGLTIYAYHLPAILPLALIAQEESPVPRWLGMILRLCRLGCAVLLAVLLALGVATANRMAVKRDLEFQATASAMTRLLHRMEQTEGYVPGETPVVIIGMLPSSKISMERPGFEDVAKAQGMRYTYGASYETATYWYLQVALGEPINLVSHATRRRMTKTAPKLPAFPAEGCCQILDGYLYLRLN